jgi:hypothetical protein
LDHHQADVLLAVDVFHLVGVNMAAHLLQVASACAKFQIAALGQRARLVSVGCGSQ